MRRETPSIVVADVAIVGGGFSGTLVAAHLLRRGQQRVALIERMPRLARGVAYSTPFASHLLNVPAAQMSAWPDEPEHFLRWWQRRDPNARPEHFAPRRLFGEYLNEILRDAHAQAPAVAWNPVFGEVVGTRVRREGVLLQLHDGNAVWAPRVVLALGNLPPANPPLMDRSFTEHPGYVRDPWANGALEGVPPDAEIFLIGTGLTAVDVVLALREQGHRGLIRAVSRRGLVPAAHEAHGVAEPPEPASLRELLRWFRTEAAQGDWRAVMDALRPLTPLLWQGLSDLERRRFLRHLRPYWDVHRHRMAPEIARRIDELRQSGQLRFEAGRLERISPSGEQLLVRTRRRGSTEIEVQLVDRVINCTGPTTDIMRAGEPLLDQLFQAGHIRPDLLGLGLDVDLEGRAFDTRGDPSARLFAVGPLRKGRLWEATAVPELRAQAVALAELLIRLETPYEEGLRLEL